MDFDGYIPIIMQVIDRQKLLMRAVVMTCDYWQQEQRCYTMCTPKLWHTCIHDYTYLHTHVCTCVCICTQTHTHTHTHTLTHTHTHSHTHTHIHTHTHTNEMNDLLKEHTHNCKGSRRDRQSYRAVLSTLPLQRTQRNPASFTRSTTACIVRSYQPRSITHTATLAF